MKTHVVIALSLGVFLATVSLYSHVVSGKPVVRASVKNRLGRGRNMTLHCRSGDDDLGVQNLSYGGEFSWEFSVNVAGTTLFYCVLGWESVGEYEFDAYSFGRDRIRCEAVCDWLVSEEGMYGLNDQTALWEFFYHWP